MKEFDNHPTAASKERERQQVAKDVEAFLLAGGEIQLLKPGTKNPRNPSVCDSAKAKPDDE